MYNAQQRENLERSAEQNQLIQGNVTRSPANGSNVTGNSLTSGVQRVERESYRLSTFVNFPSGYPVDMCLVAAHGFYYNNTGTQIKCFSCGETANVLDDSDEQWLRRIHKRDCSFANGRDNRNKSIQQFSPYENGEFSNSNARELDQPSHHTPNIRETISFRSQPSSSSSSGARTRTLNSTTPQSTNINFFENRITHSTPNNVNIQQVMDRVDLLTNSIEGLYGSSSAYQPRRLPQINLSAIFPCRYPVNPHMRDYRARLKTFLDKIALWNRCSAASASPQQVAEMGMYYLGEGDRTKCFYCNGGLQHWRRDDDPWEEHAKWFPTCEFVLQKKGPEYVHRIVARFPNLRRPQMLNETPSTSSRNTEVSQRTSTASPASPRPTIGFGTPRFSRQESAGPVLIDPQAETRERRRKIDDAWRSSGLVHQARSMGFQENVMKLALKRQFELHDQNFSNLEDFVDGILSISASDIMMDDENLPEEASSSTTLRTSNESGSLSPEASLQAIQNLTQGNRCKRCRVNQACMVFLPCGHFVCCYECRNDWDRCPICHSFVREKIRSYPS